MIGQADAAFDGLVIVEHLGVPPDGVMEGEIHLVAYLAFLLSVYDGREPHDWGYEFATTRQAAPFSDALDLALASLRRVGLVADRGPTLFRTSRTGLEAGRWATLPRNADRRPLLLAAIEATTQVTLPAMAVGLNQEPQLRHAAAAGGFRILPDPLGLDEVRNHFQSLDDVLGPRDATDGPEIDEQLVVRAALWLDYLNAQARAESSSREGGE